MQEVEPGLIGGKPGAHFFHAAERPDRNVSIRISAPGTAPVLQPQQLFWRLFYENFDGILVTEPVATGDGVVGVVVQRIPRFDYPRSSAFGRNCVAAHRVHLGDHGHTEIGIGLGYGNGSSKAGTTAADQKNIVVRDVHKAETLLTKLPQESQRRHYNPPRGRSELNDCFGGSGGFFSGISRFPLLPCRSSATDCVKLLP